jgi:hypothetical protein
VIRRYLTRLRSNEHIRCFEAPGVEPVFLDQERAIDYATGRACFGSGEIRILKPSGAVARIIPLVRRIEDCDAIIRVYDAAGNVIETHELRRRVCSQCRPMTAGRRDFLSGPHFFCNFGRIFL